MSRVLRHLVWSDVLAARKDAEKVEAVCGRRIKPLDREKAKRLPLCPLCAPSLAAEKRAELIRLTVTAIDWPAT